MQQATLLIDKYGNKADSKGKFPIYGKKGERVEIIAWHDEVAIVEGKSGRFSINKEQLKIIG